MVPDVAQAMDSLFPIRDDQPQPNEVVQLLIGGGHGWMRLDWLLACGR